VTHMPVPFWCTLPAPWISSAICRRRPPGTARPRRFGGCANRAVSHAYDPEAAVRLICWFPPDTGTVVVALFAADKAKLGDVFYDGVAARADPLIDQWKRERAPKEEA
jgi:hypothetical protein